MNGCRTCLLAGSPPDSTGARDTTLARTMNIYPTISELVPTMLQEMKPLP